MTNKISVVIPTYNEEIAIKENSEKLVQALEALNRPWELIFVNDGSTDATLALLEGEAQRTNQIKIVSYHPNKGRGFALKMGFQAATGDYVIATESDLNWGTDIIARFVEVLDSGDAEVVVASPHTKGGKMENVPFLRWLLSYLGNKIFARAVPGKLTMITGMTRGYKREVLDSLELESSGKELHVEILSKAIDLGYRVKEIPAILRWKKATTEVRVRKSNFNFKSIWRHLMLSFETRPYLLFGGFGIFFIILGVIAGIYLLQVSLTGEDAVSGRPLLFFSVLSIIVGVQGFVFGFLATQNRDTKRQLVRLQKLIKETGNKRQNS
jgi:dolichol-phosphate mannosyltransferase